MDLESRLRLQRHSHWLARIADGMLVGTVAVLVLPAMLAMTRAPAAAAVGLGALPYGLAAVPYLFAVLAIRQAFAAYARGGVLGRVMARACRRAGAALAIGAGFSAFGTPLMLRWLASPPHPMSRTLMVFDPAYVAVGVVGLALWLLGGLLDRAVAEQERMKALEIELTEFV
ncbi:hypothetical protein [Lysobacter sp. A3-1-A15]|uniref:hypothetical protein n=1 Tax=Novilysobacter viscosus TaxID=3098602 RepID=UPI002ED98BEE